VQEATTSQVGAAAAQTTTRQGRPSWSGRDWARGRRRERDVEAGCRGRAAEGLGLSAVQNGASDLTLGGLEFAEGARAVEKRKAQGRNQYRRVGRSLGGEWRRRLE
jgi:hypothetical protein